MAALPKEPVPLRTCGALQTATTQPGSGCLVFVVLPGLLAAVMFDKVENFMVRSRLARPCLSPACPASLDSQSRIARYVGAVGL